MWREMLVVGMIAAGGWGAETQVLVLVEDGLGANWRRGAEGRPSIAALFESFGWKVDVAASRGEARPCLSAAQGGIMPMAVRKTAEIPTIEPYAAVVVLPGASQEELSKDPDTLALLKEAQRRNRVIAGFCRGVRVLAAADVIAGRRIAGHPADADVIRAAGATYVSFGDLEGKSDPPPPVVDGNFVTGLRSDNYRGMMCEAIRIAVENGCGGCGMAAKNALFAFPLEQGGERSAMLLAQSLRQRGGRLASSELVAVLAEGNKIGEGVRSRLQSLGVAFITYQPDARVARILLAEKAEAAAAAEAYAMDRKTEVMVWLDRDAYFLREPSEFLLPEGATVAFRPVHHRLVGERAADPPGPFWAAVFAQEGVGPATAFPVTSTMDRERIRFYPNAGCLAVRPEAGLMRIWWEGLGRAARNDALAGVVGGDPMRRLFLHQAVLAVTILKRIPRAGIRELSFAYNYPLHLHGKAPVNLTPGKLEDLVMVRYERPDVLANTLPMGEATRRHLVEQ